MQSYKLLVKIYSVMCVVWQRRLLLLQ